MCKEIALKHIFVYYKCLSVNSAVHFNHILKIYNYEITYKYVLKFYGSKEHSKVQRTAFNVIHNLLKYVNIRKHIICK